MINWSIEWSDQIDQSIKSLKISDEILMDMILEAKGVSNGQASAKDEIRKSQIMLVIAYDSLHVR